MEKLNIITKESHVEQKEEQQTESSIEETEKGAANYIITEDIHTQTKAKIWIVKPEKQLNKTDFAEVKRKFATLQGYYSSFVKGFIFKYNPTEMLKTG